MTKQREWPNGARWARDEAAMLGTEIERLLVPVIQEEKMTESQLIRRVSEAIRKSKQVVLLMTEQGAPMRQG